MRPPPKRVWAAARSRSDFAEELNAPLAPPLTGIKRPGPKTIFGPGPWSDWVLTLEHPAFIRGQKQLSSFVSVSSGEMQDISGYFQISSHRKRSKNVSWNDWVWAHGALVQRTKATQPAQNPEILALQLGLYERAGTTINPQIISQIIGLASLTALAGLEDQHIRAQT